MIVETFRNYIVAGDLSADIEGAWIRCNAIETIETHHGVTITVAGSAASALRIEGTNDPTHVDFATMGAFTVGTTTVGTVQYVQATPGIVGVALPEWVRIAWRHDPGDPVQGAIRVRLIGRG